MIARFRTAETQASASRSTARGSNDDERMALGRAVRHA